jgi:lipopolysaccharide/colanic/teichoic acid biosynthesis glycosyltransferase
MHDLSTKRLFDVIFSASGLLILTPLLLLLALVIKLLDSGPVFFLQERVGKGGQRFKIWKFRTMVLDAPKLGRGITAGNDPRITPVGRWLRKTKCDELPQLWNVLRGEMSLVGPRPELPRYVALYTAEQRRVLELKPGITDLATLEFRSEEALLAGATDVEGFYVQECMPRKIRLNLLYASRASLWTDTKIIVRTILPFVGSPAEKSGVLPFTNT